MLQQGYIGRGCARQRGAKRPVDHEARVKLGRTSRAVGARTPRAVERFAIRQEDLAVRDFPDFSVAHLALMIQVTKEINMARSAIVLGLVGLIGASFATAQAQPAKCAKRSDLIVQLAAEYRETPAAAGLVNNETMLEIFVSKDGSTWTATMTTVNGMSCLMAVGQQWLELPRPAKGDPA